MSKYADEIKLQIEHSVQNLQAAKQLLQGGQYDAAAARASDSAFHTASALLLDEEIETSKHGDVITLIRQNFVNRRRLTKEQGEKLDWVLQLGRSENPDAGASLIQGEAQKAVEFAESFLEAAQVILEA